MLCRATVNTINIVKRSMCNNARMIYSAQNSLQSNFTICRNDMKQCNVQNNYNLYTVKRFKSRKKSAASNVNTNEESDDENDDDDIDDKLVGSKVLTVTSSSIRLDNIAKVGFGMSRNKIEEAFYGSKFRLNGHKVLKKSKEIKNGDEIDMILHRSADNPDFLVVNRILILSMTPGNDCVRVKLSKDKNLLIENYHES